VTKGKSYAYGLHHLSRYFQLRNGEDPRGERGCGEREESLLRTEAYYNVGRAFHELGLMFMALPFYEKALNISGFNELLPPSPPPSFSPLSCSSSCSSSSFPFPSSGPSSSPLDPQNRKRSEREGGTEIDERELKKRKVGGEEESFSAKEKGEEEDGRCSDLTFEAAFNLSRFYLKNGFPQKANEIVRQFMVV